MNQVHALAAVVIVGMTAVDVGAQGRGRGTEAPAPRAAQQTSVDVQVVFSSQDALLVRGHYAPRYRNLPPGQQKRLARTGQLPPGWEKKMEPFPVELERRLAALPPGYRRGVIDGHAVIYAAGTSVILDVAALF